MIILQESKAPAPDDLMEELAAYEHERWAGQARTALYEMTPERRARWEILAEMPYDELSEEMKELDRAQVRGYLEVMRRWRASQEAISA